MTLMPSSASELMRILDEVYTERLGAIEMPIRALGDPWECPLKLLPYLAWALSVDQWEDSWPENIKRQRCADAMREHRIKGSVESVESAIKGFGATAQIKEWWEQSPKGTPGTCDIWMVCQQNKVAVQALVLKGQRTVFSKLAIPVSPGRRYMVRAMIRQAVDDPEGKSLVSSGVAVLGNTYQPLTGSPFRFCAVDGQAIVSENGWQAFEGEIGGIGDAAGQFPDGAVYVRPMCIVNGQDGAGTAHLAELSMWNLVEHRQLVANNEFNDGKTGWVSTYTGEFPEKDLPGDIITDHMGLTADLQEGVARAVASTKPTHVHFQIKAGIAAQASLNISGMARLLNFHRLEMTAQ